MIGTTQQDDQLPVHKNKSLSMAMKARRYSTNLTDPNEKFSNEDHRQSKYYLFCCVVCLIFIHTPCFIVPLSSFPSGDFQSFDFSTAPDRPLSEGKKTDKYMSSELSINFNE